MLMEVLVKAVEDALVNGQAVDELELPARRLEELRSQ